jgi:hypothetical protein
MHLSRQLHPIYMHIASHTGMHALQQATRPLHTTYLRPTLSAEERVAKRVMPPKATPSTNHTTHPSHPLFLTPALSPPQDDAEVNFLLTP